MRACRGAEGEQRQDSGKPPRGKRRAAAGKRKAAAGQKKGSGRKAEGRCGSEGEQRKAAAEQQKDSGGKGAARQPGEEREMSPRTILMQELQKLHTDVEEMGRTVERMYAELFDAVRQKDDEAVFGMMKNDRMLGSMQRNIEAGCLVLITRQQPVACDLRFVTAVLKAVTDIKRIGDHCLDIAELILRLQGKDPACFSEYFASLTEETKKLAHAAVDAFVRQDAAAAKDVIEGDDRVDALFNRVKEELIASLQAGEANADECIDVLMIAKYLEKIGDHAVNIGQWAVFRKTGVIPDKHLQ